eukprot:5391139-Karenia_brevis.AAC.1
MSSTADLSAVSLGSMATRMASSSLALHVGEWFTGLAPFNAATHPGHRQVNPCCRSSTSFLK